MIQCITGSVHHPQIFKPLPTDYFDLFMALSLHGLLSMVWEVINILHTFHSYANKHFLMGRFRKEMPQQKQESHPPTSSIIQMPPLV